jgi:transcriptional regulator with XRE-family HTH domain
MARTPKARALGTALRQTREEKGLLLRQFAALINRDSGVLSRWENGERTPKPEQVAQILTKLGVADARYDEIMTLAYNTGESQWVATTLPEQRQQMAAFVDWEQNATRIVEVTPLLVPGLLQTDDYIRGIMTAPGVPSSEIASRITTRIGRRHVLTKPNPAQLVVLLGENALRQDIGGPEAALAQLHHLLKMATLPNIELRVFPNHRGWHPGLEGAFTVIEAERATSSIVFVGNRRSVLMLHEPGDVDSYKRAVDRLAGFCLPPDVTTQFIADLAQKSERKMNVAKHVAQVDQ